MTTRTAHTVWNGTLSDGEGHVIMDSSETGAFELTWPTRASTPQGHTSPEELLAAACSADFAMAFADELDLLDIRLDSVDVSAEAGFEPGAGITGVHLTVRAYGAGIDPDLIAKVATKVSQNFPLGKALGGTTLTVSTGSRT